MEALAAMLDSNVEGDVIPQTIAGWGIGLGIQYKGTLVLRFSNMIYSIYLFAQAKNYSVWVTYTCIEKQLTSMIAN